MTATAKLADVFESWWREVRQRLGERDHPVMIRSGDDLHWLYDAQRVRSEVVGEQYHRFKRVAHVPVALATLAMSPARSGAPADAQSVTQPLREIDGPLRLGETSVEQGVLAVFCDACQRFAEELQRGRRPDAGALRELAERTYPAVNRLIAAAATYEVTRLHEEVRRIASVVEPPALDNAYFVVCAGLQPRYKELSKSYFEALVARRIHTRGGAAHRVIFVEGDDDIDTVLDHVARRECNRVLAEIFTGSPAGLDQDVLGVAAERAIAEIFGPA